MNNITNFLRSDNYLIINIILLLILGIGYVILMIRVSNLNKRYTSFMKKLGKGRNIEEDLENYMYRVENVEKQNLNILGMCKELNNDISDCIQKVGIVRYTAFEKVGSDLSFALALLDEKNNGVVLNGIYSQEMSNIYAKPIEKGESKYTLSDEEKEAVEKAINSKIVYNIRN